MAIDQTVQIARAAAERGALVLDDAGASWPQHLSPQRLNMGSGERCVLGQLWGDYADGIAALGHTLDDVEWIVEHGFNSADAARPEGPWDHDRQHVEYAVLQEAWLDEIAKRRG